MNTAQQNTIDDFDFEPYFGNEQIQSILDNINNNKKHSSFYKLKTLMDINAVRAYIAHTLSNPDFLKKTAPEFQEKFTDFINEKTPHSGAVNQFRTTTAPNLRTVFEHSLTESQFNKVKNHICAENEVIKALPIIDALVKGYLKDLKNHIKHKPKDYHKFNISLHINNLIDSINERTFARELSPVIIHGLPTDKQEGRNLTAEDWQAGLKHTFDPSINTFKAIPIFSLFTPYKECPFSKLIHHVLATALIENEDGTISVSPQPKGGALPVFITALLAKHDATISTPNDTPLHAPSATNKVG